MKSWRRSSSVTHFFCLGRRVPHQVVAELAVCHFLLQFKRLQKLPDCWVGPVDKTPEAVVTSLCTVGAPGQAAKGNIPLVSGNLTEESRAGRGPQPGVLHVVSEVTHLSRTFPRSFCALPVGAFTTLLLLAVPEAQSDDVGASFLASGELKGSEQSRRRCGSSRRWVSNSSWRRGSRIR